MPWKHLGLAVRRIHTAATCRALRGGLLRWASGRFRGWASGELATEVLRGRSVWLRASVTGRNLQS